MTRTLTLSALALALAATHARAQGTAHRMPVSDPLFAAAAADSGLAEVSLSQLGLQRATHADLKKFSQRMVDEHTRVNAELMQIAAQKQIPLPRAVDARAQYTAQSLSGLSGEEFDRCYAKAQLVAHMEAASAFEAEAERGQDPQLKAFAAKTLPHIKEHLKAIRPIAIKLDREEKSENEHSSK